MKIVIETISEGLKISASNGAIHYLHDGDYTPQDVLDVIEGIMLDIAQVENT
jgi:hypothetical protein